MDWIRNNPSHMSEMFPAGSDVFHTVSLSVMVLESVEDLREVYEGLGGFAKALVQIIKTCLTLCSGGFQNNRISCDLRSCVERAHGTLEKLRTRSSNYFGIFKEKIYINEIENIEDKICILLQEIHCPSEMKEDSSLANVDSPDVIHAFMARLFWIKHFGRDVASVSWKDFEEAFTSEYGDQPSIALQTLKRKLTGTAASYDNSFTHSPPSQEQSQVSQENVVVTQYDEFTKDLGSIFEAYLNLCDPGTIVYEMGVVDDDQSTTIEVPKVVEALLGIPIKQVCCGGQHAAVLTGTGEVYTWGRGGFGRLGHGESAHVDSPKRVEKLVGTPCMQVACGFAYTAAVSFEGALYTWGAGENGRLGLGDVEDRLRPCKVVALEHTPVKEVFAGSVHTCVLTILGSVYSFGKHEYTGHCLQEDVLLPKCIPAFEQIPVRQISVGPGGYHTIALTCKGEVYTWGHNRVGQLGYSNSDVVPKNIEGAYFLPEPQLVSSLKDYNIVEVVAGWGHSAALTHSGQVYICGRNYRGQLGLGNPDQFPHNERGHPYQPVFQILDRLERRKVQQIACGGEHSVALLSTGEVYSFGAGHKGQLGHGDTSNQYYPKLLEVMMKSRRVVRQVACGNNCTLVLAGEFNVPPLKQRCVEVIKESEELADMIPSLPADVQEIILHNSLP
mmetsp:Transcript_10531/g.13670  ORF Transcript_10531/g.13670 Transcript_10531/m.13670 type:complete len:670 (-) Transcript_10531:485-2494(-)